MCGRYKFDPELAKEQILEIVASINHKYPNVPIKTGDIFPTDLTPVIAQEGTSLMRWGFPAISGRPVINARAETAWDKPLFRDSIMKRRLVIPTTGFYEWSHKNSKPSQKYLFNERESGILYLAGLWQNRMLSNGKTNDCYAILTTAANRSMREYHDRMPVCLNKAELERWMLDDAFAKEVLTRQQPELISTSMDSEQLCLF